MNNSKQCTFSPERAADYSPTSSSATNQLSLLSGISIAAKSCENEPQTDGSPICTCGKGTSDCLIHPSTKDAWIYCMQAFLVRICQSLENNPALVKAREAASIGKSSELLGYYDPDSCSLKMSQQSFLEDSSTSWPTWPRSGMTVDGRVYALPKLARLTIGIGGGSAQFATPTTMDSLPPKSAEALHREATITRPGRSKPANLRDQVSNMRMWPTPCARDYKDNGKSPAELNRNSTTLATIAGGQLSPMWVEWLMNWPIGHTELKHWVTAKSRSKPQSHGECSEVSE